MAANARAKRTAALAERRAEMWRMRVNGLTQQQIADHYGITQQAVSEQLRRAYSERPAAAIDEYRAIELDKLDREEQVVLRVMANTHPLVSGGRVVTTLDPDTGIETMLYDDGPILAAVDRLVKIAKHRADLVGLKAPVRVNVDAQALVEQITEILGDIDQDDDDDPDDT